MLLDLDALINTVANRALAAMPRKKPLNWSADEIKFLHENHGKMDDEQIGQALGRSSVGVKVFRVRQGLPVVSKAEEDWLIANRVAEILNLDQHKIVFWCRGGLLKAWKKTHEPSGREYFLVSRAVLTAWVVNPLHWVYFDWQQIRDSRLRRLCELRSARWDDEWWTTNQVAELHGVENKDVVRLIRHGKIPGYCPAYSLGGRDLGNKWRYWFVKKSDALAARFPRYGDARKYTPAAEAWILRARDDLGLSWSAIGRSMKRGPEGIRRRYQRLKGWNK